MMLTDAAVKYLSFRQVHHFWVLFGIGTFKLNCSLIYVYKQTFIAHKMFDEFLILRSSLKIFSFNVFLL